MALLRVRSRDVSRQGKINYLGFINNSTYLLMPNIDSNILYMNWLAHLLLAESDPEARLGNLLGDLVKGKQRQAFNSKIQRGIECHQAINIFTDKHPIVRCSKQRIDPEYRRFSGILIDVFKDNFSDVL